MKNIKIFLLRSLMVLLLLAPKLFTPKLLATVTLIDYDISSYPAVSIKFMPVDDWNRVVPALPKEQVKLFDNGVEIPIIDYKQMAATQNNPEAAIVISFDLAIGQRSGNMADFNYAKATINELLSFIDTEITKTALLSFDQISIIEADFTDATNDLATIVSNFSQSTSSSIFKGLYSAITGGIDFLSTSDKSTKSLILVTQNLISTDEKTLLVDKAKSAGVSIYVIYVSSSAPAGIRQLAAETDGYVLDRNELDKKRLSAVSSIVKIAEGFTPYIVAGTSISNCDGKHTLAIQTQANGNNSCSFEIEQKDLQYFEAIPAYLDFSAILPTTTFDKTIKFIAKNSSIEIIDVLLTSPNLPVNSFDIISITPSLPVLLQVDESIDVTVRFSPQDSSIVFAQLVVLSNACSGDTINITGGYPNVPPKEKTIKITNPKCNEVIVLGEPLEVSWTGLLPKDVIQLEYAYGNVQEWDTLGKNITNLSYSWNIPLKETDSLRIKAVQLWPNNVYKTYSLPHNAFVTTAFFNSTGDRIISTCKELNQAYIWNASTGDSLYTFDFEKEVSWATYMFDPITMQDKYIGIAAGDSVYIYNVQDNSSLDYTLEWRRKLNSSVNSIEFSKDGLYAVVSSNDGFVTVFETSSGNVKFTTKTAGFNCRYAQFHPTKKYEILTVSSSDGIIRFFDITGKKTDSIDVKEGASNAQTQYATYNHDGTKIAYANISTKKLMVINTANKQILYQIEHPDDQSVILFANFLYTNSNDYYLLTSASDRTLRRWNAADGTPTEKDAIFDLHNNIVNTGVFSFDGKRILSASNDKTAKIWNLDQRTLQADTTCYLRVAKAKAKCQDTINLGTSFIGELSVRTIADVISNATDAPKFKFNIRSIRIIEDNNGEFGIVDNLKFPLLLNANASLAFSFSFNPSVAGKRTAKLEVVLPTDTIYIILAGVGIEAGVVPLTTLIDFGRVFIDDCKDTLVSLAVNTSSKEINITDVSLTGINYINFREFLQENMQENIKLNPNDTLKVPLRFIPFVAGKKNAVLKIKHDYDNNYNNLQIKSNLIGDGIDISNDSIRCSIKDISGEVGQVVELPIHYETTYEADSTNLGISISKIFMTLVFNSSMLAPINESTELIIEKDELLSGRRELLISVPYKNGKQTINGLKFTVALGNDTITPLELKNIYCAGTSRVYASATGAKFTLKNICQAGGDRLFDAKGKFSLSDALPNPATNYAIIDYEILERGAVTLKLYNQIGELVSVLLDGELAVGKYYIKLDLSDLAIGKYYYVLSTPIRTETRSILVGK